MNAPLIARVGFAIMSALSACVVSSVQAQSPTATFSSTISTASEVIAVNSLLDSIRGPDFQVIVHQPDDTRTTPVSSPSTHKTSSPLSVEPSTNPIR